MKNRVFSSLIILLLLGCVSAVSALLPTKARAEGRYCDLALVLAMDASSSVDEREYVLQMKGMASALLDAESLLHSE